MGINRVENLIKLERKGEKKIHFFVSIYILAVFVNVNFQSHSLLDQTKILWRCS